MKINVNRITIDEMEVIEEVSGSTLDALADPKAPKAKLLKAVVYVVMRRDDPEITLADIGALTMDDIEITGGDEHPQKAA